MKTILTLNGSPVVSAVAVNIDKNSSNAVNANMFEDGLKVSIADHQVFEAPLNREMRYVTIKKIMDNHRNDTDIMLKKLIEFDLIKL